MCIYGSLAPFVYRSWPSGYRRSRDAENGWECAHGYTGSAEVFCLPSGLKRWSEDLRSTTVGSHGHYGDDIVITGVENTGFRLYVWRYQLLCFVIGVYPKMYIYIHIHMFVCIQNLRTIAAGKFLSRSSRQFFDSHIEQALFASPIFWLCFVWSLVFHAICLVSTIFCYYVSIKQNQWNMFFFSWSLYPTLSTPLVVARHWVPIFGTQFGDRRFWSAKLRNSRWKLWRYNFRFQTSVASPKTIWTPQGLDAFARQKSSSKARKNPSRSSVHNMCIYIYVHVRIHVCIYYACM